MDTLPPSPPVVSHVTPAAALEHADADQLNETALAFGERGEVGRKRQLASLRR